MIFGFFGIIELLKYFFNVVILELIYNKVGLFMGIKDVLGLIVCFLDWKKLRNIC